jgi:hypothetical protein
MAVLSYWMRGRVMRSRIGGRRAAPRRAPAAAERAAAGLLRQRHVN